MASLLDSIADSLHKARECANLSQYDSSIIYFDSIMVKIRQYAPFFATARELHPVEEVNLLATPDILSCDF